MFSASRRACSEISFLLLFLFTVSLEYFPDRTYLDDDVGECSDDSQHLLAIDKGLRLVLGDHADIVSGGYVARKLA